MDMLRPHCLGIDLNARHGAVLAVAEVVHALAEHAHKHGQDVTQYIGKAWWRLEEEWEMKGRHGRDEGPRN